MARIKGRVILNARDFVVTRDGSDAWRRVLGRLPDEEREALASMIPAGWYPMALNDHVNRAVVDSLGGGNGEPMEALGRYAAETDLKTIHRLFLRMANPAFVLERVAEFWRRYQDSGTWTVVREADNRVSAHLTGWASRDEATCVRLGAYSRHLFVLVGARHVWLERRACEARGDPACVFAGGWS